MNIRIFLLILIAIFKLSACRVVIDVVSTANNTNDRLSIKPSISFSQKRLPAKNTIVVDETITYQTIIGWGGAMTEAASFVWSLLLPELQQEVIDAYFSPRGLSYSLCRITMGSPDFALNKYNCDNHTGDYELKHFNIDRDRRYVLPFVKRAQETNKNLEFFFSPWSPPGWMKKNGDMNKSIFPDGLINSTEIYKSWALYFSKFITAYNKEGVKFWGFTVQNEPEANVPYPCPRISLDHPNVKMIIYDSNRDRMTPWVDAILSDTETSKYISGV
ncbi:glucosylceramidase, partial [Acrasis kona]